MARHTTPSPFTKILTLQWAPHGDSTDRSVNQQQPSGTWFHLGAFAMAPGQNHRVEINAALEGETVADAVRFVSSGVSAPGISYVHADHLGSPQKMTDSSKAIVWDAVYTPFGQVHSITGTATNNQRFPGQYADSETGYSYNYFRDYDPTTGRYIESDPIGLDAGLHTYSYVGGNPILFIDPFGLKTFTCRKPLDALGGSGTRTGPDISFNPLYHQYTCIVDADGNTQCGGQSYSLNGPLGGAGGIGAPGAPSKDEFRADRCEINLQKDDCFENCLREEWDKPRPWYGIPFGTDCQEYDNSVNQRCRKKCNIR